MTELPWSTLALVLESVLLAARQEAHGIAGSIVSHLAPAFSKKARTPKSPLEEDVATMRAIGRARAQQVAKTGLSASKPGHLEAFASRHGIRITHRKVNPPEEGAEPSGAPEGSETPG